MKISEYENQMKKPGEPVARISIKGIHEPIGDPDKTLHYTVGIIIDGKDKESVAFMKLLTSASPSGHASKPIGPFNIRIS